MAEIAERYKSQLKRIKKCIDNSYVQFKPNNLRFHEFQKFVFETALSQDDEDTLKGMGKPIIEFNITNAPISRLCGEFSKQEPSIYVTADTGTPVDPRVIEVVEGHLRHIMIEAKERNTQYKLYKDQLSGGFSDAKVWTEYANEMSMDQVLQWGRVYEPTLVGFDPNAREITKFDGQFCYEVFPMASEDFHTDYPDIDLDELKAMRGESAFNWSYEAGKEDIVAICDFYEKKKKRKKIVKLTNQRVVGVDQYEKDLEQWNQSGHIEQPPLPMGEPRWTTIETICRYRLVGNEVIEYVETDYKYLPLVYFDGDSVIIKASDSGIMQQFTKPYVYHAKGIQRLVNFSGQVIGNDFENMVMHKFKVAKESLPSEEEWMEAYKNPQVAAVLVYNQYSEDKPDQPLNPPQEIARVPLPPEVTQTFNTGMQMLQNILGSYDAALGINDNQLSGIAVVESATQSNAAAMPYLVAHMQGLTQVARILLDLIPKYYATPRTIPVVGRDGRRSYKKINQNTPDSVSFNYDENALSVRVEAGPSYAIAKNRALEQIIALMKASPQFAQFMSEAGLDILLDNMDFRGIDIIKEKVKEWEKQQAEIKKKMMNQPQPQMIAAQAAQMQAQTGAMKAQSDAQVAQAEVQVKAEQVLVDKSKVDNDRLEILLKAGESHDKMVTGVAKAHAEEERAAADLGMKVHDQLHQHSKDVLEMVHNITKGDDNG